MSHKINFSPTMESTTKSFRRSIITCSPLLRQVSDLTLDSTSNDYDDDNDDIFAKDNCTTKACSLHTQKSSFSYSVETISTHRNQHVRKERKERKLLSPSHYAPDHHVDKRVKSRLSSKSDHAVCFRQHMVDYDYDDDDENDENGNNENENGIFMNRTISDASLRTLGTQRFQSSLSSSKGLRNDLGPKPPKRRNSINNKPITSSSSVDDECKRTTAAINA
jgi:hypothetical protein